MVCSQMLYLNQLKMQLHLLKAAIHGVDLRSATKFLDPHTVRTALVLRYFRGCDCNIHCQDDFLQETVHQLVPALLTTTVSEHDE